MISQEEYIQLKAFARQDGLLIGALWIITFGCFVGSMSAPDIQIGSIAGVIATPFVMYYRLKRFRNNILDGSISYGRALTFCLLTTAYASLIIAAATMIYMTFFDDGMLMSTLQRNITMPEMQQSLKQAGMDPEKLETQLAELGRLRPIDFTFSIFFNCIITSGLMAIVIALAGKRQKRQEQSNQQNTRH